MPEFLGLRPSLCHFLAVWLGGSLLTSVPQLPHLLSGNHNYIRSAEWFNRYKVGRHLEGAISVCRCLCCYPSLHLAEVSAALAKTHCLSGFKEQTYIGLKPVLQVSEFQGLLFALVFPHLSEGAF